MNAFILNTKRHNIGFSLIELLISMTIFTAVITMAVGTMVVVIDANAKAQNTQDVVTNLNFALDSMIREIRTGYGYFCAGNGIDNGAIADTESHDCADGNNALSIVEGGSSLTGPSESRISYRFNNGAVQRRIGDDSWFPITSDEVSITEGYFVVTDSNRGDDKQASVTVYIEGKTVGLVSDLDTTFTLQTTVTPRLLDL